MEHKNFMSEENLNAHNYGREMTSTTGEVKEIADTKINLCIQNNS